MTKYLTLALIMLSLTTTAQIKQISTFPFQSGEKLSYVASYNMKGLMTELAGIDMEVIDVPGKKKPIFRLKFTANTLSTWDDYVKVRHAYQTYVDAATIKPLIMAQDSDVKGQITKAKYKFKHKSGLAEISLSKNNEPEVNSTLLIKNNSYDVVSLIYLARTLDYNNFSVGKSTTINAVALERNIPLNIKYLGKKMIKVDGMGETECYKIGLVLKQKFIVEPNVTFMYITTDQKRLPILITTVYKEGEAQIKLINKN